MKIKSGRIFSLFLLFLPFTQVLGQVNPNLYFFHTPSQLFLVDQSINLGGEYFDHPKKSVQLSIGYGDDNIFKQEISDTRRFCKLYLTRKYYKKTFDIAKPKSRYWAYEAFYKNANDLAEFIGPKDPETSSFDITSGTLRVNTFGLHGKFGLVYLPQGFPSVDLFLGAGLRFHYNFYQHLPDGYRGGSFGDFLFGRSAGKAFAPGIVIGLNLGVSSWK